jgi:methylthioribose-1-phosphate isomerase
VGDNAEREKLIIPTVDFVEGAVRILDQTLLPADEVIREIGSVGELADAIRRLAVRGAPAIGIAAAYGMLLSIENLLREQGDGGWFFDRKKGIADISLPEVSAGAVRSRLSEARTELAETRPTAVNLFWALDRMTAAANEAPGDAVDLCRVIAREAFAIHEEELEIEFRIGENGSRFIHDGMGVLTHCNAGGLATAGYGTALAVIYRAHEEGKRFSVFADETRPLLQGARLTVWELQKHGIDVTLLCDNAAASLIASGRIDAVIVGADRIVSNGDTANKIGTCGLAHIARAFDVPFYVAAPWSTFDTTLASGAEIPVEERDPSEVTGFSHVETAPRGTEVYNPAFDITPAELITAIITDRGVIEQPNSRKIKVLSG